MPKSVFDYLRQSQGNQPQYGYQNPNLLMNNFPSAQQSSGQVIDPFSKGQYYGRVYDPQNTMGGQEMNILGLTRQQDI